jgi:Rrf2 family iron-sulfur cluster assembly transcriptional regulator
MTLNRECEYALMGMAALATEGGGRPLMLSEIASREELPLSFLSKIFQKLLKHGLVVSHRGVERGYTLAREARAVPLRTILEAIEGPDLFERCVFSHRPCAGEENPCLLHKAWQDVRPQVQTAFERTTLQDVVEARRAASPPPVPARRAPARHR